jgi:chromosomal replication initiation ATPase DnaA
VASQLPLPFVPDPQLTRAAFIEAGGNLQAVRFIDRWPHWPAPAAALYGPSGSGKSHLTAAWSNVAGGLVVAAETLAELSPAALKGHRAIAVEDVDRAVPSLARDRVLFALLEATSADSALLLTGRSPPTQWPVALPDLASRFAALLAFPLWEPDEGLLRALAHKLFADRQLRVPEAVVDRMLHFLERSPEAIRDFIALADARALAEGRPITVALIRELLAG